MEQETRVVKRPDGIERKGNEVQTEVRGKGDSDYPSLLLRAIPGTFDWDVNCPESSGYREL